MILRRSRVSEFGIFGELLDDSQKHLMYTLEHAYPDGDGFLAKLLEGTYTCTRYNSPEHGKVFQITGVPDFQGQPVTLIEIHIGNYNRDSKGCVLVGTGIAPDMITGSHTAFDAFMKLQEGVDSFTLTVVNA